MTIPLINIIVVRINTFVCTLIFEMNNAIPSPYSTIFSIMYWEYFMSKLSQFSRSILRAISVRVIMYIRLVVAGERHFASRRATVCDCHWDYPPGVCVGNLNFVTCDQYWGEWTEVRWYNTKFNILCYFCLFWGLTLPNQKLYEAMLPC